MLADIVKRLLDSENSADSTVAGEILAPSFIAFTRARGEEQGREAVLHEIAHPLNPNLQRTVDPARVFERVEGKIGVVRSLVLVTDRSKISEPPMKFRNLHVFEDEGGRWRCVIWQANQIKIGEPVR